jgi:hypothetical protein
MNGRLNNRQLAMKGMVTNEKRKLKSIKRIDERYEPRQLPTYTIQHLEYNPTKNNVYL